MKKGLIDIDKAYSVVKRLEPSIGHTDQDLNKIAHNLLDIHLNQDKLDDGTTSDE